MRKGAWVQFKGRVGILVDVVENIAIVDFVDENGWTVERQEVKKTSVSPAAEDDIPESRK